MKKMMVIRGFAPSTQKSYLQAVKNLINFCNGLKLTSMDYNHIREFLLHAINVRNLSSQYVNSNYSGIKFIFEAVFEREWNMKHVPRVKVKRHFPVVLSKEEVKTLLRAVPNLKHKAALVTIYSAGLRVSEALNLKITDIDSKRMQIFVRQGKGSKDRYVLLAEATLAILRKYFKEYKPKEWLFQTANSGSNPKPLSTRTIQWAVTDAKKRAGFTKKITTHTLRHSFATHLVEQGVNLIKVKNLLGHDTLETTMLYIHLANKDILSVKSPIDIDGGFECE